MTPTVLITGCDTGIGREFARQYAAQGWTVIATFRDMENALPATDRTECHPLDITVPAQFAALKKRMGERPIDLLLSNAGIGLDTRRLGDLDYDYVQAMLTVNTVGPLRLVDTFADNVAASSQRRIAAITSRMGSIGHNLSGGHYGYRASKAGLNALMRSLAIDLFARGITVVSIHPGWVDTASGGSGSGRRSRWKTASPRCPRSLPRLGSHETGQLFHWRGTPLEW